MHGSSSGNDYLGLYSFAYRVDVDLCWIRLVLHNYSDSYWKAYMFAWMGHIVLKRLRLILFEVWNFLVDHNPVCL